MAHIFPVPKKNLLTAVPIGVDFPDEISKTTQRQRPRGSQRKIPVSSLDMSQFCGHRTHHLGTTLRPRRRHRRRLPDRMMKDDINKNVTAAWCVVAATNIYPKEDQYDFSRCGYLRDPGDDHVFPCADFN